MTTTAWPCVSLDIPGIVIRNAEVVSKSYPGYWDALRAAGFTIADADAETPDNEDEA